MVACNSCLISLVHSAYHEKLRGPAGRPIDTNSGVKIPPWEVTHFTSGVVCQPHTTRTFPGRLVRQFKASHKVGYVFWPFWPSDLRGGPKSTQIASSWVDFYPASEFGSPWVDFCTRHLGSVKKFIMIPRTSQEYSYVTFAVTCTRLTTVRPN